MSEQRRVIATLVEHKPGVLFKVSGLFRRRNFNIESISVGPVDADTARMTITVNADEGTLKQVVEQLSKLVDVIEVTELRASRAVVRELALVKVCTKDPPTRSDVIQYVNIFRGRVVDVYPESLIVEITGTPDKIDAFVELMQGFGIREVARTGITALSRGFEALELNRR
jgi:acetolactate synthase-1/3 small subunit